ncbi:protein phosphatase regulator GIP1 Ecym_5141 [Eremothecium cymbalariae DBVPG|uniref:Uncharacterized protein n=1 Tax=Eremothecium cymbalariae (strain CBS 270.75 / DBVPG 7215 / KCTC 17166 / NRRL Y-17582) TaxID=931890 RepID=I6NCX6_ERECY|nr:hypothetical protein Ecym_5141 [Eremothecium cymbalariae DBVPG\
MSIVLNNNLSINTQQLPDVLFNDLGLSTVELMSDEQAQRVSAALTSNENKSSAENGSSSEEAASKELQKASHKKRQKAKKLLRKWKQSVKQKLHMTEYNQNGNFSNNQGTVTSIGELKDALSCYYRFKSDESKIEEMFETIMFRNNTQSPPVTRDQELRELVPFEIIGEQKLNDLRKKLDVFSNCLSALDDDKPWNQASGFNSPVIDSKVPRSEIGGSGSPPELVSGISTLDSGAASESLEKNSFCQILSGEECGINGSSESIQEGGHGSGSSKTSSIVEKLASFVRTPKTSETSPMDTVRLSSPLDSGFEVQRLVIPTFRMNAGKNMDVSHIVENLKSGTITERDLLYLASMYTSQEVGFMDKSFYDEQGNEADNESATSDEYEIEHQTIGTDDKECCKQISANENNDSVKFDRFSYLVIYNASKKCDSSRLKKRSIEDCGENSHPPAPAADSGYDGDDEAVHSNNITESEESLHKSILKSKSNDKEFLESQRAVKCDKVSVDEFLEFFEKYENERREGEYVLSFARDKQLSNYYSKEYFPEIGRLDVPVKASNEFARSKMATEHNIGRELMDVKNEVGTCTCADCSNDTIVEAN